MRPYKENAPRGFHPLLYGSSPDAINPGLVQLLHHSLKIRLEGRELDLEDVCIRVREELYVVFHYCFLKFRKNL
jgi:hypothetical protein